MKSEYVQYLQRAILRTSFTFLNLQKNAWPFICTKRDEEYKLFAASLKLCSHRLNSFTGTFQGAV